MRITKITVYKTEPSKRQVGTADIVIDGELLITDILILKKSDGNFCIAFPRGAKAKKRRRENIIPLKSKTRSMITEKIIGAYLEMQNKEMKNQYGEH